MENPWGSTTVQPFDQPHVGGDFVVAPPGVAAERTTRLGRTIARTLPPHEPGQCLGQGRHPALEGILAAEQRRRYRSARVSSACGSLSTHDHPRGIVVR